MTVQTAVYTVTLDNTQNPKSFSIPQLGTGSTTTRWVVIYNYTPYVMSLSNISDDPVNVPALGPYTANKFKWSNLRGSINVQWTNPLSINVSPLSKPLVTVEYSDDPTGSD